MRNCRMFFIILVLVNVVLLWCLPSIATSLVYNELKLDEHLKDWLPKGWYVRYLRTDFLEGKESEDYVIWHIYTQNNTSKKNDNQILVFTYNGEKLTLVWKSDIFEGELINFNFYNLDNSGYDNINIILGEYQNGQLFSFLRSYDWNRELTQLAYPKENLKYFYAEHVKIDHVDSDDDFEIVVRTVIQEDPKKCRVETYCYKDGLLELEYEEIEPKIHSQPLETDFPVLTEDDKLFDDFLHASGYGFLLKAHYLHREGLYLLDVGKEEEEGEYNKYMVVKKEHGTVKLLYRIDSIYNDTIVGYSEMQDINLDGNVEIIFEDITTVHRGSLIYILSLSLHSSYLISPVIDSQLDNGRYRSQMYVDEMRGPIDFFDLNSDGIPELGTTVYYESCFATQYWIWDPKYRIYAPYKLEIWDEETNSPVYIDDPLH